MIKFAPKIFSNDTLEQQKTVIKNIKSESLEVAIYGYNFFPDEIEKEIIKLNENNKIIHLWQNKVYCNGYINNQESLLKNFNFELSYAKQLNIKKAVIHNNIQQKKLDINNKNDIEKYFYSIIEFLEYSYENNLKLYIENVFEDLYFFEFFYYLADKHKLNEKIGFCLDTGHTRVFTKSSLDKWIAFIKDINNKNFDIHYHIHVNDSTADQHYNLSIGNALNLLDNDKNWSTIGFLNSLKELTKITPNSIFCLEHGSDQTQEARDFIDFLIEDKFFD